MSVNSERNLTIDLLRGLASIWIIFFHVRHALPENTDFYSGKIWFENFIHYGHKSVNIFFMLSSYLLLKRFRIYQETLKNPIRSFYIKRFLRVLPLWWLACLIYFFVERNALGLESKHLFSSMTFIFGFFKEPAFNYTTVGWSLFVEESFYLFAPFLFLYVDKLWKAVLMVAVTYIVKFYWFKNCDPAFPNFCYGSPLANYNYFFLGITLFYFEHTFSLSKKLKEWLFCIGGLSFFLVHFPIPGREFLITGVFCSVVLGSAPGILLRNPLSSFMIQTGQYCYGIYLFHLMMLKGTNTFMNSISNYIPFGFYLFYPLCVLLCFLVTFIAAKVSFDKVEAKISHWGRKFTAGI
ncbi:MAG: acyltransferase [Halobacteriovoraceae bacterium]|jgi:peptidoglycan/LPS O-acetylase OafA/YrhL|nr:acyltransferase [Halobacteriovoraceae bacterium]MBT5093488.1 acyltransferase [Halobacteriovoraceae bacterium]